MSAFLHWLACGREVKREHFNEIHPRAHFFNWWGLRRQTCVFQTEINTLELFSWMRSFAFFGLRSESGHNEVSLWLHSARAFLCL